MSDQSILKRTTPLMKVVKASIVDLHEDMGRYQQLCTHWAARGLKKLERETLKSHVKKAVIRINKSTRTAVLPPDFNGEKYVGVITDAGKRVDLRINNRLADTKVIEDIPCEDKCEKCQQDKSICNDLTITEDVTLVVVGDSMQEQTVIKKLYPDGSYFLETRIPVWDVGTSSVVYTTQKEFITKLDLKACGCIEETEENIEKIKCCCPEVFDCHFSGCDNNCNEDYGGYRIHEESGYIYFDKGDKFIRVYLEYYGFIPKINGQYHVPEVAFETLVNWVKFKQVENKRNVPLWERQWTLEQYRRERKNMMKVMGRISLSQIFRYIWTIPKFDLYVPPDDDCDTSVSDVSSFTLNGSSGSSNGSGSGSGSDSGNSDGSICDTPLTCPPVSTTSTFTPFDIAVIAGNGSGTPTPGTNVYQNDKLKNALGINFIIVNNTIETILAKQFVLDTVAGTITRYQGDGVTPNDWFAGDILIVPTFFKYINGQIVSQGVDPGVATPRVYEYLATGTEGDAFVLSGIIGLKIWGVWRAGQFRKPITTTPTDSEHIKVGGTDLGGNKGIMADGNVGLESGDALMPNEQLIFGYYE